MLRLLGPCWLWQDWPSQNWQIPRDGKQLTFKEHANQPIPATYFKRQLPPLKGSHMLSLKGRVQTARDSPKPQSLPAESIQPCLFTLPCAFRPAEAPVNTPPDQPNPSVSCVCSHGRACPLPLGIVTKYLFNGSCLPSVGLNIPK